MPEGETTLCSQASGSPGLIPMPPPAGALKGHCCPGKPRTCHSAGMLATVFLLCRCLVSVLEILSTGPDAQDTNAMRHGSALKDIRCSVTQSFNLDCIVELPRELFRNIESQVLVSMWFSPVCCGPSWGPTGQARVLTAKVQEPVFKCYHHGMLSKIVEKVTTMGKFTHLLLRRNAMLTISNSPHFVKWFQWECIHILWGWGCGKFHGA